VWDKITAVQGCFSCITIEVGVRLHWHLSIVDIDSMFGTRRIGLTGGIGAWLVGVNCSQSVQLFIGGGKGNWHMSST
jgi:hypothetical protein